MSAADILASIADYGTLTTSLAVQEAARAQSNSASTGNTGTTSENLNPGWGKAIPILMGHTRSVALPLWFGGVSQSDNTVGNISGAGYRISFASLIGLPEPGAHAARVEKVFFNQRCVYDRKLDFIRLPNGEQLFFTFYDGRQTDIDPVIGSIDGPEQPAYTGRMYIVFRDVLAATRAPDLITTYETLPEVQVEIQQFRNANAGDDAIALRTMGRLYQELATFVGYDLSEVKCNNMDDLLYGLQLNQTVDFATLIAQLSVTFRVDVLEQPDGTLLFDRRADDRTEDYAVTPDQLMLTGDAQSGNTVSVDRVATNELPVVFQLSYLDLDHDFIIGTITQRRTSFPVSTAQGENALNLSLPVVIDGESALSYAGVALFDMWAGKQNFQINLPPRFFFVEPGDLLLLTRPSGRTDLCKVVEVTLGADLTIAVTLSGISRRKPVPYFQGQNQPQVIQPQNPTPSGTLQTPTFSGLYSTVIDNTNLQDNETADTVLHFAASQHAIVDYINYATKAGATIDVPASTLGALGQLIDGDTVLVNLFNTNATIPPQGMIAVGVPTRWEIISYTNAVVNGEAVTLSGITRGLYRTDNTESEHVIGDIAIFDPQHLVSVTLSTPANAQGLGVTATPPTLPKGTIFSNAGFITIGKDPEPVQLIPMPSFLQALRQSNGDIVFTWFREGRTAPANFWDDPPAEPGTEQYQLKIDANSPAELRVTPTARTYTYTYADQQSRGDMHAPYLYCHLAQIDKDGNVGFKLIRYVDVRQS